MRRSTDLSSRLRAALTTHVASYSTSPDPLFISAQVAQAVSLQGARLAQLPRNVAAAIDAAAADANRKAVRKKGRELTDDLKRMTRTKHRGGTHPNLHDEPPQYSVVRSLRGKRRQKEHRALADLSQHAALSLEDSKVLPESFWDGDERSVTHLLEAITHEAKEGAAASAAAGGALYGEDEALSYAVMRFPACYAALQRVLLEVKRAAPRGWRPESILDYGAGPGTATWAAHSIWTTQEEEEDVVEGSESGSSSSSATVSSYRNSSTITSINNGGSSLQVTAVEPSGAMTWLGQSIHQRLVDAHSLKVSQANSEEETQEGKASIQSTSTPPPPSIRWMSRLFTHRNGKKERRGKSSPSGGRKYDIVVAGYVLSEVQSARDRRKLISDLWQRTGKYLILVEPGTPFGADGIHAAREQILTLNENKINNGGFDDNDQLRNNSSGKVAHVVAPCPHDGPCPLQGRTSWCHFGQRFERTAVQRHAKASAGRLPPRSHQDERFSYIVLAKGPRVVNTNDIRISGSFPPDNDENLDEYVTLPSMGKLRAKRIGFMAQQESSRNIMNSISDDDDDEESEHMSSEKATIMESEMRRLLMESMGIDEEDGGGGGGGELPAEMEAVLQQTMHELRLRSSSPSSSSPSSASVEHNDEDAYSSLEDSGSSDDDDDLTTSSEHSDSEHSEDDEENTNSNSTDPYGASGVEAETAANISSRDWSRLLRPPRKRSGHVVLDLCSAIDEDGRYLGGDQGVLLRQIVSKGNAVRGTGGVAPFKIARHARWGNLWPIEYQNRIKAFVPPAAGVLDVEDE